jgi:hypothetical protein
MKTFVYFRKYPHYDAKFVEECEIRIRINFKNAKIRKHSFRIQKAKFAHAWCLCTVSLAVDQTKRKVYIIDRLKTRVQLWMDGWLVI